MTCRLRGCGTRVGGGIYACCGLSPSGRPVEEFLFDPPRNLPEGLNIAPQGIILVGRPDDDTHHVADWVGSKYYPNVADFVEEVRHLGMSRRLPSSTDFSLIKPGAKHILIHGRAIIAHLELYRIKLDDIMKQGAHHCPKGIEAHQRGESPPLDPRLPMCAGIWWEDIVGGEPVVSDNPRDVVRKMPWGSYRGARRPDRARIVEYIPAFFGAFPITALEVIRDTEGGKHEAAMEKVKVAKIPVELMDE